MRRVVGAVLLLQIVARCNGFVVQPKIPVVCNGVPGANSRTRSSWKHHGQVSPSKELWSCENPPDDSVVDTNKKFPLLLKDFKFGASVVFKNYFAHWRHVLPYTLVGFVAPLLLVHLGHSISANTGRYTVLSLLRVIKLLCLSNGIVFYPAQLMLALPVVAVSVIMSILMVIPAIITRILVELPNESIKKVAASFAMFWSKHLGLIIQWAEQEGSKVSADSTTLLVSKMAQVSLLKRFYLQVVAAPLYEETKYRWAYNFLIERLSKTSKRFAKFVQRRSPHGVKLSTTIGSFFFACAHLTNWIPAGVTASALVEANVHVAGILLSMAVAQFVSAFLISQRVMSPAFEERGLGASIGAHAAWNGVLFLLGIVMLALE